ncbi:MAG: methylenetetrahydrofolate reductase, partial [Olpidium bornovanus]
ACLGGRHEFSFAACPPTGFPNKGIINLYDRIERMYMLGPEFIDITWGAGGSTSQLTLEICATAQSVYGLETCMQYLAVANCSLTCTNMHKDMIDRALKEAKDAGIQNILALRGDPPRGQESWTATEGGFSHAADLVRYIRNQYGDYFGIAVHFENPDREDDLCRLKEKVDAGADYIVTQLFYDVDLFLKWVEDVRAIGIYGSFHRAVTMSKTFVPKTIRDALEPIKDDDQAVKDYGIRLA